MKRPKTQPTGRPPSGSVRPAAPPQVDDGEDSPAKVKGEAWYVRTTYFDERSRFESIRQGEDVYYVPPKKYDGQAAITRDGEKDAVVEPAVGAVWDKIVAWCVARKVNPQEYVRFCFKVTPYDVKPPEPGQLCTDKYLAKWPKYRDKIEDDLATALVSEENRIRREIVVRQHAFGNSMEYATLHAITNSTLAASPLMRYCLAVSAGRKSKKIARVADNFLAEAVLQFMRHPKLYKRTWSTVLPKGFSKLAKAMYPRLMAHIGLGIPD